MSYCVTMTNAQFFIAEDNKYEAYKAYRMSFLGSRSLPIHSIEDALKYSGYIAENDAEDNIIGLEYNGEKFGDEEKLFEIIAPYVQSGSFIEMMGEDHSMWRWVFTDGTLEEITPKIEW